MSENLFNDLTENLFDDLTDGDIEPVVEQIKPAAPDAAIANNDLPGGDAAYRDFAARLPEPLPGRLLPVPAFDDALLPASLNAFARDAAGLIGCPVEYIFGARS